MKRKQKWIVLGFFAFCFGALAQEQSEARPVSLTTCEWAPFYASSLPRNGFVAHLFSEAFRSVGYVPSVTFMDWADAMTSAKAGEHDALLGAYYSDERAETFYFSNPVYTVDNVFIARKACLAKYDGELENLNSLRIGVSKGYTYSAEFDRNETLTKIIAADPQELVKLILNDELDVIVIQIDIFLEIVRTAHSGQADTLQALGPSLTEKGLFLAVSKGRKNALELVEDFNKGLSLLVQSGRYTKIVNRKNNDK